MGLSVCVSLEEISSKAYAERVEQLARARERHDVVRREEGNDVINEDLRWEGEERCGLLCRVVQCHHQGLLRRRASNWHRV